MDKEIIEKVVNDIINNTFFLSWDFYFLYLALIFIVSSASFFLASYFAQRGKNFATKTDFDNLKDQLATTTKIAEEIKTNISHDDWMIKEYKTLRRVKLEDLLLSVSEVDVWFEKLKTYSFNGEDFNETSPMYKVRVLACLYFEDLAEELSNLRQQHYALYTSIISTKQKLLGIKGDEIAINTALASNPTNKAVIDSLLVRQENYFTKRHAVLDEGYKDYLEKYGSYYDAKLDIEERAAQIMGKVLNAKVINTM